MTTQKRQRGIYPRGVLTTRHRRTGTLRILSEHELLEQGRPADVFLSRFHFEESEESKARERAIWDELANFYLVYARPGSREYWMDLAKGLARNHVPAFTFKTKRTGVRSRTVQKYMRILDLYDDARHKHPNRPTSFHYGIVGKDKRLWPDNRPTWRSVERSHKRAMAWILGVIQARGYLKIAPEGGAAK